MRPLRDGKPVHWEDETLHRAAFASDPELYSLLAFAEEMHPWQRARILLLLLTSSRCGHPPALCDQFERTTVYLLTRLRATFVLPVFLAVRRIRANHPHTRRAILSYLLHHPHIDGLLAHCPHVVKDCLEHTLGKNTARWFGLHAPRAGQEAPLPRLLKRYGGSEAQVRRIFRTLYFRPHAEDVDEEPIPLSYSDPERREPVTPETILEQLYRQGTSPELVERLEEVVREQANRLPALPGRIALLLDASASMRGADRFHFRSMALAVAFERVLKAKCSLLRTYTVGGFGWPPAPEGPTDFGRTLIDALEAEPQLVVLITDGYENLQRGDAARILATLPRLGLSTPIVCCRIIPQDRAMEAEGMALPTLALQRERDFVAAFEIFDLLMEPEEARARLVERLRMRRDQWEREVYGWTANC